MAAKTGRLRPKIKDAKKPERGEETPPGTLFVLPPPEQRSGRALRPLWRDLIIRAWGEDPHKCPCCPGMMTGVGTMIRRSEVEFFLRLHGLWEGIVALPPPPEPPFDIDTMEPIEVPPHAIWRDDFEEFGLERWTGGEPDWDCHGAIAHANGEATPQVAAKTAHPPELDRSGKPGDGRRLVLDSPDPLPEEHGWCPGRTETERGPRSRKPL